jgi:predicted nucleic acid-binding protein
VIFVDSSVWIDLLRCADTPETRALTRFADQDLAIVVGDLVLTEVLQGTRSERDFERARTILAGYAQVTVTDREVAVAAARHYRTLRALGVTVRKTVDTLIATRCIRDRLPLLYRDRDFDHFVRHLGLVSALPATHGIS